MNTKYEEFSNLIFEISRKLERKLSSEMIDLIPDLSIKEIHLIEFISNMKKTMGEIAEEFNLTPGTITPMVDKLVNMEYLKRERDDEVDRRKVFISLSEKGRNAQLSFMECRKVISKIFMEGLSVQEQDLFMEIFKKILVNLKNA